jgi:Nucleotidyl transferase AbiEii toxin, Type IV TA system
MEVLKLTVQPENHTRRCHLLAHPQICPQHQPTRISPLQEAAKGRRVHVTAYLGPRFASFHLDVVVGTAMSGAPDHVPPLTPLEFDGLERPPYRVFPVADHVADKLCAMLESHDRGDGTTRASSRVKDLVDIAPDRTQPVDLRHGAPRGSARGRRAPRARAA